MRAGPFELDWRPERGGRITSLRLRGAELLEQGLGVDDPAAADFVAGGAQGWDEMVPTLEPAAYPEAPWAGLPLPDHGEAWRLPWRRSGPRALEAEGAILPWRLRRTLLGRGSGLRFEYQLWNRGRALLLAYWCAYPLFRFEPGMEVGVPGGEELAALPEGASRKLRLAAGSLGSVRLGWPSLGRAVRLGWDPALLPYVGVWACNGGLGGYRQLAVEPATGGGDHPNLETPPPRLRPGQSLSWWLELREASLRRGSARR